MSRANATASLKKRTNLSINEILLNEAKELGINISSSAESGIKHALIERKRLLWLEDNKEAITSSNDYVVRNGLPLEKFRNF
ncbi:type II toxin-antitoxin system CcdA family antitoxin [Brumicola pallidula]|jgi:antitoxin CcdA|uniref:Potential post-segregation antitoxin n=1 Tax=Brumicola pallidula DSM 14239 = ACAM 615 TaxID=1121922 RepID=K6ZEH6_9ALTE|nr:type II toxin-antitoxin system CcdA family antitoxin [Glaciecola pallidula]GAC27308.1 potential post-segregation antitoxin [Glaciecola pallidula DSM 14239 = ACAM 615]